MQIRTTPVHVYGPEGCGKTRHAAELAAAFGCTTIVDEWTGPKLAPVSGPALTLSTTDYGGGIPYDQAIKRLSGGVSA